MVDKLKAFAAKLLFSLIETIALAAWLVLIPVNPVLAIGVLALFLALEHVVSYNSYNHRPLFQLTSLPLIGFLTIAILEPLSWAGWLALISVNQVLAAIFLLVTLGLGHVIYEMNSLNHFRPFYAIGKRLVQSFDFTIEETAVGIIWLLLTNVNKIGAFVFLFVGLLIEHLLFTRKQVRA